VVSVPRFESDVYDLAGSGSSTDTCSARVRRLFVKTIGRITRLAMLKSSRRAASPWPTDGTGSRERAGRA
jgi:hypothetical protein